MTQLIGRSVPRLDGAAKVTGRARFVDDLVFPGAWYGMTVRSTEPHARLLGIVRDPGFDWSSVVVVTAADLPGDNVVNLMVDDQPALAADVISHVAQPVALVAAPDAARARAARDAIRLRTEPLPAVLDPFESERSFAAYDIAKGDAEAALATADLVIEATYRVGYQEQLYLEPQGVIAVPREGRGVTIYGSLQCPFYVHAAVKRALCLDDTQLAIVQAETGGGFGGKEEYPSGLAIHAGLLALRTGRPIRMIYDRHEDIAATTKRHPAVVRHRTGVSRDGRLLAQEIEVVMDAGAFSTLSPVVLSRGSLHSGGPYLCPNVHIRARAMATNTPPNGAFRGFGAPQTEFAAEMQVSRVADALGVSPAELRRRWAYRVGDTTPTGQVLRESVGAVEALDKAVELSGFETARAETARARDARGGAAGARHVASGTGIALGWHGAGFTGSGERHLASVAGVELDANGCLRVLTDSTEIGQGSRTVLAQLVADALGVPLDEIEVARTDTSVIPNSGPTVASRTTMVVGGLLVRAARQLRNEVETRTGGAFAETYRADAAANGARRIDVQFEGFPNVEWDEATHLGDAYPCFSYAAAVARVDVDLDTGEVAVRSVVAADEIGTVVNPLLASGQVEGGTLQAVGYATIEEMQSANGRYVNDRLATYLIPTALDAPELTTALLEKPFSGVPHGAKGLGELPMDVGAPAVVAAIHDATGVWIDELPATPERILAALGATVSGPDDGRAATVETRASEAGAPPTERAASAARTGSHASLSSVLHPARPAADAEGSAVVAFRVNGLPVEYSGPGGRRLIDVLRADLGLTGTKEGCGEGECGTCSVLVDGRLVTSCLVPVGQVEGCDVVTVEGLGTAADPDAPDALQTAFLVAGAAQCGFCTPGMLLAGHACAASSAGADPSDGAIRDSIAGNLCRCTGYTKIVEAIRMGAPAAALGASPDQTAAVGLPVQVVEGAAGVRTIRPDSLEAALRTFAETPCRPLAGGTDLMVELAPAGPNPLGRRDGRPLLDLSGLTELRGIRVEGASLVVGALTTYAELRRSPIVAANVPVLAEAAAVVGASQIQNRGTIGGNVVNASPAGDMLPVLLATDAVFRVASIRGERSIPAAEFWTAYRQTALAPDELLVSIAIPLVPERVVRFRKVGTRRAQAISKVVMAVSWHSGDDSMRDVRVALGSVAPVPLRARSTEAVLEGAALGHVASERGAATERGMATDRGAATERGVATDGDQATERGAATAGDGGAPGVGAEIAARAADTLAVEISPIDDVRSTAAYRRAVAARVLRRLLIAE